MYVMGAVQLHAPTILHTGQIAALKVPPHVPGGVSSLLSALRRIRWYTKHPSSRRTGTARTTNIIHNPFFLLGFL